MTDKKAVGRPRSDDKFVQFPIKVPTSIKEIYDSMNEEVKSNIRKHIIETIKENELKRSLPRTEKVGF